MTVSTRVVTLLSLIVLGACAREVPRATAPNDVLIVGTDFSFAAPDTIPAGVTRLRLVSNGPRYLHHAQLMKLEDGKNYDSLMAALGRQGPPPPWAVFVTGPNAPAPGDTTSVIVDLEPGNYALICFIPDSAMVPHVVRGMSKALVVREARGGQAAAAMPEATMELRLNDYDFVTSAPLTAGTHLLKIINDGPQLHEMFVARLDSGYTADSLIRWVRSGMHGQPRAMPNGGVTAIAANRETLLELELEPGRYALLCFLPDAGGRGEHVDHGMVKEFTVN